MKSKKLIKTAPVEHPTSRTLPYASRYVKARESLRELLDQYEDGARFFTEAELILKFGYSQGTIRRAVGDLVQEGLLIRKVPAGTFVRKGEKKPFTIGIFINDTDSIFAETLIHAFSQEVCEQGCWIKLYRIRGSEKTREIIERIQSTPEEEGFVLLMNSPPVTWDLYLDLTSRGFRSVTVDTILPSFTGNYLGVDNEKGIQIGLKHLVDLGHRRITFLASASLENGSIQARVNAFEQTAKALKLSEAKVVTCGTALGEDSYEAALKKIPEIMAGPTKPTAIFGATDLAAYAAIKWMHQHQIRIPEEISILGFDECYLNRYLQPSLSTVAQPIREIARQSIELLSKKSGNTIQKLILPPLIVRESSGPASAIR